MVRPSLDALFRDHQHDLRAHVARAFPARCASWADEAVSHAFCVAVARPALLDNAWKRGGRARMVGFLKLVAWRHARGQWRRATSVPLEAVGEVASCPAGQLAYVHAHRVFEQAIARAIATVGPARAREIRDAVIDKLCTGDSDGAVATRHGIPREYVNRAKRQVSAEVLG